jgi:hypothetical protein
MHHVLRTHRYLRQIVLPHRLHDVEVFGHDVAVTRREVVHQLEVQDPGLIRKSRIAVNGACEDLYWVVACGVCRTRSYACTRFLSG